jgi:uncharacterized protein (DUF1697 family)
MADLRSLMEDLGFQDVRTLLGSGNVVFSSAKKGAGSDADRIETAIRKHLGVTTRVTVLTGTEVVAAVRENPLGSLVDNPSRLLLMVLRDVRTAARVRPLLKSDWTPEAVALRGRVAYLWCANGIIDSRLSASVGRVIGDSGTARNLATMTKLAAMVESE